VVVASEDGHVIRAKALTTPDDYTEGVINRVVNASRQLGVTPENLMANCEGLVDSKRPNYWLGVHGMDMSRVGLAWARGDRHGITWLGPPTAVSKSVTLSVAPRLIGSPKTIRYSVAVGREMGDGGTGGGEDFAPNAGTWLFVRYVVQPVTRGTRT
jgi:hypothetical protein